MRIRQIRGHNLLTEVARGRLENSVFQGPENAARVLQQEFPHHVIVSEPGRFSVFVRDRSFHVAQFETVHEGYSIIPADLLSLKVKA